MFLKCFGHTNSSDTGRGYPTIIEELCPPFSLADLKKATNNFHQNRLIEDDGHFMVYKGYLQHNDSSHYAVVVKRFHAWEEHQFRTEIELLCQLHHPNIISPIGFCIHKEEKILVNKYMSNGSLLRHLHGGELSWKKRLEICIGAARGLHYLHAGAKRTIIHRDIRPVNILLDDNMQPKLTNFGLSIMGAHFMSKPKPIVVEHLYGTIGYIAPEYICSNTVTDKSDVYSFGMVLLEVVWARTVFDMVISEYYPENPFEEEIDPNIKGKIAPKCWQIFIDITKRCLEYEADERPTMGEVEVELERAMSLQEQADVTNTNGHYTLHSTTIIDVFDFSQNRRIRLG